VHVEHHLQSACAVKSEKYLRKGEETGEYDVVDAATTKYYLILEDENAGLR
jgi:hypothetical protein